jgi:5,6-dimethylbenzimidazole synthase
MVSAFLAQSRRQYPRTTSTRTTAIGAFSSGFHDEFKQLLKLRRDVRRFDKDLPVSEELLADTLRVAFNTAPSVGLSEPWRIVRVESQGARERVLQNFIRCNEAALEGYSEDKLEVSSNKHEPIAGDNAGSVPVATPAKQKSKKDLYASLKLSGMKEALVHLAIFCDEGTSKGSGLGAQTMPETKRYSVVCAIQSFWLLARSRGLGVGWVSILDPKQLVVDLNLDRDDYGLGGGVHDESPAHSWTLVGYLCVGYPDGKEMDGSRPELERFGWEERRGKGLPPTINSISTVDIDDKFHFYRDLPIKVV